MARTSAAVVDGCEGRIMEERGDELAEPAEEKTRLDGRDGGLLKLKAAGY